MRSAEPTRPNEPAHDSPTLQLIASGLANALRHIHTHHERDAALEALAKIRGEAVLPLLTAMPEYSYQDMFDGKASKEDGELKRVIEGTLVEIGSANLDPLIAALEHEDPHVRGAALEVIATVGAPQATDPLVAALRHQHNDVRQLAAFFLKHAGWRPDREDDSAWYWVALQNEQEVRALGPKALDPLISTLCGEEWLSDVEDFYLEALKKIGDRAIGELAIALEQDLARNPGNVIQALVEIDVEANDPRCIDALLAALESERLEALLYAARALAVHYKDDRGLGALIRALSHKDCNVREGAAHFLGEIGNADAVDPLISMLQDERPSLRQSAIQALGELGDWRAAYPLLFALRDPDSFVADSAASALGTLRNPASIPPLISAARYGEPAVRVRAIRALRTIGDSAATEVLVHALHSSVAGVAKAAALALDELDWAPSQPGDAACYWVHREEWAKAREFGRVAVEPLIVALEDRLPYPRWCAAKELGKTGDARAIEPLIAALADTEPLVRSHAATALLQICTEMLDRDSQEREAELSVEEGERVPPDSLRSPSERLIDQDIFFLLGVERYSNFPLQNRFLDELQQAVWEDFVENDLAWVVTPQEREKVAAILQDAQLSELDRVEQALRFLLETIPNFEAVMVEKASEVKGDLFRQRIAGMEEHYAQDQASLERIAQAETELERGYWRSAAEVLNHLSHHSADPDAGIERLEPLGLLAAWRRAHGADLDREIELRELDADLDSEIEHLTRMIRDLEADDSEEGTESGESSADAAEDPCCE